MRRLNTWVIASLLSFGPSLSGIAEPPSDGRATAASDSAWVPLFDGKSLRGWYPQIQNQKTGEDPAKFFQVDEGAIHVYKDQVAGTAVPNGYLATEAEYANYHLRTWLNASSVDMEDLRIRSVISDSNRSLARRYFTYSPNILCSGFSFGTVMP
jgi:hypothetical protein